MLFRSQLSESIRTYRLLEERAVLVTRILSKLKESDIQDAEYIGYSKYDPLMDYYFKSNFPKVEVGRIKRLSSVNSHQSMVEALLSRDCLAVLPFFSVHKHIDKKVLRLASDKENRNALYLVHLENHASSKRNETFRKFILEKCKATVLG